MHLALPGGIGHFCTMQVALTCSQAAKNATYNISARFHEDNKFWWSLCVKMKTRLIYLAKIVHRDASEISYTDASQQGAEGSVLNQTNTELTLPGK